MGLATADFVREGNVKNCMGRLIFVMYLTVNWDKTVAHV